MIQMLRVFKHFPEHPPALANINLSIHKGEWVGLEGGIGSGKTTLLRLMGLLEKPSQGQMVVDGVDINTVSQGRAFACMRRLIHLTPEEDFFPKLSLKDNLTLAMDVAQLPVKTSPKRSMEALACLGLEGLWNKKPGQLLPAQRLRLLLARALIRMPRMLLVDGCMDSLEEGELGYWLWVLQQCQANGCTVVVAGRRGFEEIGRRLRLEEGALYAAQ